MLKWKTEDLKKRIGTTLQYLGNRIPALMAKDDIFSKNYKQVGHDEK